MTAKENATESHSGTAMTGNGLTIIMIISDDRRVSDLADHFRQRIMGTITVVANVDQGMQAVFEKKPSAVFIQDKMGGVTGAVVSHHIKTMLGDSSPRFILLHDSSAGQGANTSSFDAKIDLTLGGAGLVAEFEKALRTVLLVRFKDCAPMESLPVTDEKPAAPPDPPGNGAPLRENDNRQTAGSRAVAPGLPQGNGVCKPAAPSSPDELITPGYLVGLVSEAAATKKPFYVSKGLLLLLGATLLVLAASLPILHRQIAPNGLNTGSSLAWPNKTTNTGNAGVPSPSRVIKMPSSIPLDQPDRDYASTHPGWERYLADGLEFRVYREAGTIRAIQVLALGKASIGERYFQSLLKELSGAGKPRNVTKAANGGYLQERGTFDGGIEFIIYRRRMGGEIRAIVVSMT